jgi:hypothetical protein
MPVAGISWCPLEDEGYDILGFGHLPFSQTPRDKVCMGDQRAALKRHWSEVLKPPTLITSMFPSPACFGLTVP